MPPKPRPARRATAAPDPIASDRHELPSGGWVQLRPGSDLRAKHRDAILAAIPDGDKIPKMIGIMMPRAIATHVITAWDMPYLPGAPLPADDPDGLSELTVADENELIRLMEPYMQLLNPAAPDPAQVEDPDSPTGPSGAPEPA